MLDRPIYSYPEPFRVLCDICARAGLVIQFVDLPRNIYARSKERTIQMPLDNRFFSDEHAAIVLGHELAHFLVNPHFPEIETEEPLTLARQMLLESECDRLGTYLCALANATAAHTKEKDEDATLP